MHDLAIKELKDCKTLYKCIQMSRVIQLYFNPTTSLIYNKSYEYCWRLNYYHIGQFCQNIVKSLRPLIHPQENLQKSKFTKKISLILTLNIKDNIFTNQL